MNPRFSKDVLRKKWGFKSAPFYLTCEKNHPILNGTLGWRSIHVALFAPRAYRCDFLAVPLATFFSHRALRRATFPVSSWHRDLCNLLTYMSLEEVSATQRNFWFFYWNVKIVTVRMKLENTLVTKILQIAWHVWSPLVGRSLLLQSYWEQFPLK